jgi:hypothetical protein
MPIVLVELLPMVTPGSPGSNDANPGGQIVSGDELVLGKLLPTTSIAHLLSEEKRQKEAQERREFEAVGKSMFLNEATLYPMAYESVRERIASGASTDVIRGELSMLRDTPDLYASMIREAYEDVLAGRPPRFSSTR